MIPKLASAKYVTHQGYPLLDLHFDDGSLVRLGLLDGRFRRYGYVTMGGWEHADELPVRMMPPGEKPEEQRPIRALCNDPTILALWDKYVDDCIHRRFRDGPVDIPTKT